MHFSLDFLTIPLWSLVVLVAGHRCNGAFLKSPDITTGGGRLQTGRSSLSKISIKQRPRKTIDSIGANVGECADYSCLHWINMGLESTLNRRQCLIKALGP